MKINITVNIRLGVYQEVKTEDGMQKVRAVYEAYNSRPIGFIRKAVSPRGRSIGWVIYTKTGRQAGVYTLREFALLCLIQAAILH